MKLTGDILQCLFACRWPLKHDHYNMIETESTKEAQDKGMFRWEQAGEHAYGSSQVAPVVSMLGARPGLPAPQDACLPTCQGLESSMLLPSKPDVSKIPLLHKWPRQIAQLF